jgi:hypothetical protein
MRDAFGVNRFEISKGFSPAQLEVMHSAGGAFARRASAARAGKQGSGYTHVGQRDREFSTSQFPRGAKEANRTRASGYRNEYVATPKGTKRINPDSDAAWKLNRAKANGATFGSNNPANRPRTQYVPNGKGVPRLFRKIKARATNAPKTSRSV